MSIYEFAWDAATVLAAAQGACVKVDMVKLIGCHGDKIMIETSSAMTAGEIAAVKAAIEALTQDLIEE